MKSDAENAAESSENNPMYGKIFQSTFTGSMFGCGANVIAVWAYIIANTRHGHIELNPMLLAAILGEPQKEIEAAIEYLCQTDPDSRSKNEEGRRLVKEGQFQYRVVNSESYRSIQNEDDRREYNRLKQRESRARRSVKASVNNGHHLSAHTDTEVDAETDSERIYNAYPRKISKSDALRAIRKALKKIKPDALLAATEQYAVAVKDQDRNFIPYPATWFNKERFRDDPSVWLESSKKDNKQPSRHDDKLERERLAVEAKLRAEGKIP